MTTETVMIYFDDLDAMGVVHNGRYVILFERALGAYWTRAGWPYDPGQPRFAEVFFVVRENTITYHVPISRAGAVQVQLWLEHLGTTSVVYGFRILSGDGTVVHAEGRRVQVRLDPATLRPAPIGAELREACRPLLARGEGDAREVALSPTGARQPGTHRQPTGEHPAALCCPRTISFFSHSSASCAPGPRANASSPRNR